MLLPLQQSHNILGRLGNPGSATVVSSSEAHGSLPLPPKKNSFKTGDPNKGAGPNAMNCMNKGLGYASVGVM